MNELRAQEPGDLPRLARLALGVDLEIFQPRRGSAGSGCTELPHLVATLLDLLESRQARATFFTVGETAREFPDLVAELSARGHEIASHGHRHVPVNLLGPDAFARDLATSLQILRDLTGRPVIGFRAPLLSLTGETAWAYDILRANGICYSSSVFPAANVQYGWPECPPHPHWRSGILEYPVTVMRIAGRPFPAVGGAYLRIFPWSWIRRALGTLPAGDLVTSYIHPYDYDVVQPFAIHRELTRKPWLAPLLFYNRRDFLRRLAILLDQADALLTFSEHYTVTHEV